MNHEKARRPSSLCWYCANAVPSDVTGCPWSRDFSEVEGWDAICTDHLHRNEIGADSIAHGKHAYLVKECPMYLPDSKEYIKEHMKYDEGLNALALSVIKIGVIDLIAAYRLYLQTAYRRGDRYVIIDNKLLKLHVPHEKAWHEFARKEVKAIRKKIYRLNKAREDIFPGVPKAKKAISKECKRLYLRMTDMRVPSTERLMSAYGQYKALHNFFVSDYAYHLSELDPKALEEQVKRQVEDELDFPQMEFIIRPKKKLKGIKHGTRR